MLRAAWRGRASLALWRSVSGANTRPPRAAYGTRGYAEGEDGVHPDPDCCMSGCVDCVRFDKYLRDANPEASDDPVSVGLSAFEEMERKLAKRKEENGKERK